MPTPAQSAHASLPWNAGVRRPLTDRYGAWASQTSRNSSRSVRPGINWPSRNNLCLPFLAVPAQPIHPLPLGRFVLCHLFLGLSFRLFKSSSGASVLCPHARPSSRWTGDAWRPASRTFRLYQWPWLSRRLTSGRHLSQIALDRAPARRPSSAIEQMHGRPPDARRVQRTAMTHLPPSAGARV